MNIIETPFNWKSALTKRKKTDYAVLHHSATKNSTVDDIHKSHINNGWSGIGYHFYIRKDGKIYRGRPLDTIGAHTEGANSQSIGICFEGNFENELMNTVQMTSGQQVISYIKSVYPNIFIKKHKDFNVTSCPGKNFRFDEMKSGVKEMTKAEAVQILADKVGLENKTIDFMLAYKYGDELIIKLAKAIKGD